MSCPQQQHALTSLSCGPPTGSCQSAGRVNGIHDQLRYLLRVGDQREVAGGDLDRRSVHAVSQEPLEVWRDRAILTCELVMPWPWSAWATDVIAQRR